MAGERQIERWIVAQTRKLGGQAYRNIRRRAPVRTGRLMRSIRQTYRRKTTSVSPASPRLKGRTSTSYVRAGGIRAGVPYAQICRLVPCRPAERAQHHRTTGCEARAKYFHACAMARPYRERPHPPRAFRPRPLGPRLARDLYSRLSAATARLASDRSITCPCTALALI